MVTEISAVEVKAALDRGEPLRLVDCREPAEVAIASIAGAEVIPFTQWLALAPQRLTAPEEAVVIFCHAGVRSAYAALDLGRRGFTRVQSMAGGIDAWSLDVDAMVPRY